MVQRVLVRIPSGSTFSTDRFTAVDIETAKGLVAEGSEDDRSWYAGASIVNNKDDYARYGYKECPLNGVVMDDESIHISRALYEEYMNSRNKVDDLSDETEGTLLAELQAMKTAMAELMANQAKTDLQRESESKAEAKAIASDKAKVKKASKKE